MEEIRRDIIKYYLFQIFNNTLFFIPVLVPIYSGRGFSMEQILFAETIFYITIFVFEIPTGITADFFGKKKCMIISSVGSAFACVLLYFTSTYIWLILSQIIFGIATTFSSGADSAYLYEFLKKINQGEKYGDCEGKSYSLSLIFSTITIALGSIVFKLFGEASPFLCNTFFYIMAAVAASTLPKIEDVQNTAEQINSIVKKYLSQVKQTFQIICNNMKLIIYSILFGIFFMTSQLTIWINQLKLSSLGVPVQFLGVLIASLSLGSIVTSWNIGRIKKEYHTFIIILSCIVVTISFLGLGLISGLFSLFFLLLLNISKGMFFPLFKQQINLEIEDKSRATVLSVQSSLGNILFSVIAPLYGKALDVYSLNTLLLLTSGFLFIIFLVPAIWAGRNFNGYNGDFLRK